MARLREIVQVPLLKKTRLFVLSLGSMQQAEHAYPAIHKQPFTRREMHMRLLYIMVNRHQLTPTCQELMHRSMVYLNQTVGILYYTPQLGRESIWEGSVSYVRQRTMSSAKHILSSNCRRTLSYATVGPRSF